MSSAWVAPVVQEAEILPTERGSRKNGCPVGARCLSDHYPSARHIGQQLHPDRITASAARHLQRGIFGGVISGDVNTFATSKQKAFMAAMTSSAPVKSIGRFSIEECG